MCVRVFVEWQQSPVSRRSVAGTVAATVAGLKNANEMHNSIPHKKHTNTNTYLVWSAVVHFPRIFQTGDCGGDCTGD